jgi:hypothetical protein
LGTELATAGGVTAWPVTAGADALTAGIGCPAGALALPGGPLAIGPIVIGPVVTGPIVGGAIVGGLTGEGAAGCAVEGEPRVVGSPGAAAWVAGCAFGDGDVPHPLTLQAANRPHTTVNERKGDMVPSAI